MPAVQVTILRLCRAKDHRGHATATQMCFPGTLAAVTAAAEPRQQLAAALAPTTGPDPGSFNHGLMEWWVGHFFLQVVGLVGLFSVRNDSDTPRPLRRDSSREVRLAPVRRSGLSLHESQRGCPAWAPLCTGQQRLWPGVRAASACPLAGAALLRVVAPDAGPNGGPGRGGIPRRARRRGSEVATRERKNRALSSLRPRRILFCL